VKLIPRKLTSQICVNFQVSPSGSFPTTLDGFVITPDGFDSMLDGLTTTSDHFVITLDGFESSLGSLTLMPDRLTSPRDLAHIG
jgi:hypothetical protein